jgi:flagellar protein FlaG
MSKIVAIPAPKTTIHAVDPARAVEAASGPRPDRQPQSQTADLRLMIEEDEGTGSFVYKVFDRRTGEVVQQFPREEVLRLRDDPAYAPGRVIDSQG